MFFWWKITYLLCYVKKKEKKKKIEHTERMMQEKPIFAWRIWTFNTKIVCWFSKKANLIENSISFGIFRVPSRNNKLTKRKFLFKFKNHEITFVYFDMVSFSLTNILKHEQFWKKRKVILSITTGTISFLI